MIATQTIELCAENIETNELLCDIMNNEKKMIEQATKMRIIEAIQSLTNDECEVLLIEAKKQGLFDEEINCYNSQPVFG